MNKVFIGIGTNLGNRHQNIIDVKNYLLNNKIEILKESSIADTDPVDYLNQPKFLNQIIIINTLFEPLSLLEMLQQIELKMGKNVQVPKGPRVIDLDILLYNNTLIETDNLIIPHPEIRNRLFILKHLVELDSNLIDPISKKYYKDIYYGQVNKAN